MLQICEQPKLIGGKVEFNASIKKNQFQGDYKANGITWNFDNGQFSQSTEVKESLFVHLSYHYGRVFVNTFKKYDTGGQDMGGVQRPFSKLNDQKLTEVCRVLLEADKKAGVVPADYPLS